MTYAIISDSTLDLNEELKNLYKVTIVPFKLNLLNREFLDDGKDYSEIIEIMSDSCKNLESFCPTKKDYLDAIKLSGKDDIFILTSSKSLSDSYKNAVEAAEKLMDESELNIHIIDTVGASSQATLIYLKLVELIKEGLSFFEIVQSIEYYILNTRAFSATDDVHYIIEQGIMDEIVEPFSGVIKINPILKQD